MPTLRERFERLLVGNKLDQLQEVQAALYRAYLDGPFELSPRQLARHLSEQYADLLDRMNYEMVSGYGGYTEDERKRAVNDSKRMHKYSVLARWMVNLWTFYGLGEDISIVAKDDAANEVWQEFWAADRNASLLAKDRLDEISRWLLVTGERFFVFFAAEVDGEATVRSVKPDQIATVYTNPNDDSELWFYERTWTVGDMQKTMYYPDWQVLFADDTEDKWATTKEHYTGIPANAELAEENGTVACILFVPFLQLDEDSPRGWPLLAPHGTPWLRAQKEFMQDRATVTKGIAAIIRRYRVGGGSRAVDSIRDTLASAFQSGGSTETNPPPIAGSSEIINRAIEVQDLPLRTGASDAKSDSEMFSWMALLGGGLFPHYAGLGDAYRLATATAMERPLEMQFSLYRKQLGAMFRTIVRIVLQFDNEYGNGGHTDYEVEISTDRLVEIDLELISGSVSQLFDKVIAPMMELGGIPAEAQPKLTVFFLQTVLQAMGASNVEELIDEEMFEAPEAEETGIEEQLPTDGRVQPRGKPLATWNPDRDVPITPEDVARAIRNWERRAPRGAQQHGILTARTATPEEEAAAALTLEQEEAT